MSVFNFPEGEVLLLNKPLDWTSFDVVNKVRRLIQQKIGRKLKVGHAGTLDPKATGLLIVCTGKKTKEIQFLQTGEKEYTGKFKVGVVTPSYDRETEEGETFETDHLNLELLREKTKDFMGDILQMPPMHSAIRKDGKRLYTHARKGKEVEVEPRPVFIREFEILGFDNPYVSFRVVCGKGTYIRSLAFDFGKAVNSGAYLWELERTRIGEFLLSDALDIDTFANIISAMEVKGDTE